MDQSTAAIRPEVMLQHRFIDIPNELEYEGQLKGNLPHGEGIIRDYRTNEEFRGLFNEGEMIEGVLSIRGSPDYCYEGSLFNGEYHGQGTLSTPEGIFNGEFRNGKKEGKGVFKWRVGRKYVG